MAEISPGRCAERQIEVLYHRGLVGGLTLGLSHRGRQRGGVSFKDPALSVGNGDRCLGQEEPVPRGSQKPRTGGVRGLGISLCAWTNPARNGQISLCHCGARLARRETVGTLELKLPGHPEIGSGPCPPTMRLDRARRSATLETNASHRPQIRASSPLALPLRPRNDDRGT